MQKSASYSCCCHCQPPAGGENRRGFVAHALAIVCGGAAILTPAVVGLVSLLNPLRQKSAGSQFTRLASLDMLADGTPLKVPVVADHADAWTRFPAEAVGAVFLCRQGDSVTALQVLCPHEGCPIGYHPESKAFMCPCHKQPQFDLSGKRVDGEASYSPRDMDSLEVEVRNKNEVWVKYQTFNSGSTVKVAQG